jgi:hypothetical protein
VLSSLRPVSSGRLFGDGVHWPSATSASDYSAAANPIAARSGAGPNTENVPGSLRHCALTPRGCEAMTRAHPCLMTRPCSANLSPVRHFLPFLCLHAPRQ